MGRSIELDGALTKTCEKCHGSGTIEVKREAQIDELSDLQVQTLLQADMYRLTKGMDEEDVDDMPGSTPATGSTPSPSSYSRGSIPSY